MPAGYCYIGSLSYMVEKPPKPPCWRDFLKETSKSRAFSATQGAKNIISRTASYSSKASLKKSHNCDKFTDLSILNISKSAPEHSHTNEDSYTSASYDRNILLGIKTDDVHSVRSHKVSKTNPFRSLKRSKIKLRRTQSQATINESDLPDINDLTVSLAELGPKQLGLTQRTPSALNKTVYLDASMKRCEEWLQEVNRAANESPSIMSDIEFGQGSGDELEIPEETWEDMGSIRHTNRSKSITKSIKNKPKTVGVSGTKMVCSTYKNEHVSLENKHKCKFKASQIK